MPGYLAFRTRDVGFFTERLARTGPFDVFEGVRVAERRVFMAKILYVSETRKYSNLDTKGSTRVGAFRTC